jgi:hypothetical protein
MKLDKNSCCCRSIDDVVISCKRKYPHKFNTTVQFSFLRIISTCAVLQKFHCTSTRTNSTNSLKNSTVDFGQFQYQKYASQIIPHAKNRGILVYSTNATLVSVKNTVILTLGNFCIYNIPVKMEIFTTFATSGKVHPPFYTLSPQLKPENSYISSRSNFLNLP